MSVLVTMRVRGDVERFRSFMESNPERFAEIAPDAQAAGALHHRFGIGDGFVVVVDEWDSAESFQKFFQSNEKIAAIMRDSGAADEEPEITFSEAVDSPDQF